MRFNPARKGEDSVSDRDDVDLTFDDEDELTELQEGVKRLQDVAAKSLAQLIAACVASQCSETRRLPSCLQSCTLPCASSLGLSSLTCCRSFWLRRVVFHS